MKKPSVSEIVKMLSQRNEILKDIYFDRKSKGQIEMLESWADVKADTGILNGKANLPACFYRQFNSGVSMAHK